MGRRHDGEPMNLRDMQQALERASELGALGSELLFTEDHSTRIEMDGYRVGAPRTLTERRVAVRVFAEGGREGRASGDPGAVHQLVEQAMLASTDAKEDPSAGPLQRQVGAIAGLSIADRRHSQLTVQDKSDVLSTAHRAATNEDPRLSAGGFRYRDRLRVRRFVSSRGVALEETGTTYVAEGEVTVRAPEGTLRFWDSIASRSFASIASLPFGTSLARRATALLQSGEALADGPVRVVMPARVVASVFAWLAQHFTVPILEGDGAFFLRPGPDVAVDPRLHLLDDGTIAGGLRSRSFDDRGAAPVPLTLLREGRVDGRLVSVAQARIHGVPPTGHARGDELVPSNLVLKSGNRSVSASLADLDEVALLVDALPDLSDVDPATGDYDATVHGVVMRGNKPVGAMRSVRLRGNLGDVLRRVLEVCSDTDRVGHVDAPALIVEGFRLGEDPR